MLMRPLVILSLACIAVSASPAQDSLTIMPESSHIFTFSSGLSLHSVRDEMISPLLYHGTQAPLALSYRYRGTANRHSLLVYYDNTELHSTITRRISDVPIAHYINDLHVTFEYTFSARAAVFDDLTTTLFLGARFSSFLNLRDHHFLQDKNHMSAEQITGLGLSLLTETPLDHPFRSLLSMEVTIPCISYALLNRRYNANVSAEFDDLDFERNLLWQLFTKGEIVTFNRFFGVQADVSYLAMFSDHIGADLRYRLIYYAFAQEAGLSHARVLNDQFLVGLTVTL